MAGREVRVVVVALEQTRKLLVERRGIQRTLSQDRHERVDGNAGSSDEPKAQTKGQYLGSDELVERQFECGSFADRPDETRLAAERPEQRCECGKLVFGASDHDYQRSGFGFGQTPKDGRLAICPSPSFHFPFDLKAFVGI